MLEHYRLEEKIWTQGPGCKHTYWALHVHVDPKFCRLLWKWTTCCDSVGMFLIHFIFLASWLNPSAHSLSSRLCIHVPWLFLFGNVGLKETYWKQSHAPDRPSCPDQVHTILSCQSVHSCWGHEVFCSCLLSIWPSCQLHIWNYLVVLRKRMVCARI